VSTVSESDPRRLADTKAKEIAGLAWEELDQYGKRVEQVSTATGRRFRVKSIAFWDMEAWPSTMYVIVKVYPIPRWRRFWGYSAVETRGGWEDDEAIPERPAS
jgi:hypothetical protein